MPGRVIRAALTFLLVGIILHPTVWAAGVARHHRPNVPVLGWYTDAGVDLSNNTLAGYRQRGMSLVVASTLGDPVRDAAFLDRAATAGVAVLFEPPAAWIHDGDWTDLRAFVERYRASPALYGWYLFDEPDFNHLPPAQLARAYRVVKQVDPHHPVAVVFTLGGCRFGQQLDRRYLNGFDLLLFDDYPFYTFMRSQSASMAGVREFRDATRSCVAAARNFNKQGPIMVEQGFGKGVHDGPFQYRDPSYAEEQAMFDAAVRAGAPGILFFHDGLADRHMRTEVRTIVASWYRTIPPQYRPRLPAPQTSVAAPTGAPGPPLPVCPSRVHPGCAA